MNVIITTPEENSAKLCTKKLIDNFQFDEVFAVMSNKEIGKGFAYKSTEYYYNGHCVDANYEDKLEADDTIPIDNVLLKQFEPYMTIAMKMAERVAVGDVGFEERVDVVFRDIEYWNTIIVKHDIKLFMAYDIPHSTFDYVIHSLCKIKNIPCLFRCYSFIDGYSCIAADIENFCPSIFGMYNELLLKYQNSELENIPLEGAYLKYFQDHTQKDVDITPYYMKPKPVEKMKIKDRLKNIFERIENKKRSQTKLKGIKRINNIFRLLSENFSDNIRIWFVSLRVSVKTILGLQKNENKAYTKRWNSACEDVDLSKKYIYFALHYQPEATTLPMGGYFVWQLLAIKMISKCLPENVYIYVKENPKQTTCSRTKDFEKQLKEISNVKLVKTTVDTFNLIDNCIAVASITGTALIEGVFKGKPGLMFGNFITQYAPGIFKVYTNAECKSAIDFILTNTVSYTKKELRVFLLAASKVLAKGVLACPPLHEAMTDSEIGEALYAGLFPHIDAIMKSKGNVVI